MIDGRMPAKRWQYTVRKRGHRGPAAVGTRPNATDAEGRRAGECGRSFPVGTRCEETAAVAWTRPDCFAPGGAGANECIIDFAPVATRWGKGGRRRSPNAVASACDDLTVRAIRFRDRRGQHRE